jgi:hypothetical protein
VAALQLVASAGCSDEHGTAMPGSGGGGTGGLDGPTASGQGGAGWDCNPYCNDDQGGPPGTPVGAGPPAECAEVFASPEVNECGSDHCCPEMQVCEADFTLCFDQDTGQLDSTLPDGAVLATCMMEAGCFGAIICDSGIELGDPTTADLALALCLGESCCAEFNACTSGGRDVEACTDCLNAELPDDRCFAALECAAESCATSLGDPTGICESGLSHSNASVAECLGASCCDEILACTGPDPLDQAAVEACIDCYNSERGGPLCDFAIACRAASCSTTVCDSGVSVDDLDLASCLGGSCCDLYRECARTGSPGDLAACEDCLASEEGGLRCDDARACQARSCPIGEGGSSSGQGGAGSSDQGGACGSGGAGSTSGGGAGG